MLRLEQISNLHSKKYTINPAYHAQPLAEIVSKVAERMYRISRTLHPNSLELQTLLRAATEATLAPAFVSTYLHPPDLRRVIQTICPTLTWRQEHFREFLKEKREEFKLKGDWNPRVGGCSKEDWYKFYPYGIPALHVRISAPLFV